MARLPQTGGDSDSWGDILNDYLTQSHKADGSLKNGSVAETALTSAVQTKLNQTAPVTKVNNQTGDVTITKADIGLGVVDNTADSSKPISTATATALATKVAKGDLFFNIKDYGVIADGVTDTITTAQSALNTIAAAGGGTVIAPAGTYMLSGRLSIPAGITVRGVGAATIFKSTSGASAQPMIRLNGATDVGLEDVTVDANGRASSIAVIVETANTSTVAANHRIHRCTIRNATNNAIRVVAPTTGLELTDNTIEDCASGMTLYEAAVVHNGIRITGNRLRRVGLVNIQLYGTNPHQYVNVTVSNNDLRDFTNPSTAIPIELSRADSVIVEGNVIGSVATRGLSIGDCYGITIVGNHCRDQTIYLIELNSVKQFAITGNVAVNCASLTRSTGAGTADGVITGNTYVGCPTTTFDAAGAVISLPVVNRVHIADNLFVNWQNLRQVIRVGEGATTPTEDVTVASNTFINDTATSTLEVIVVRCALRAVIKDNNFLIKRDLVSGDNDKNVVALSMDASSTGVVATNNHIEFLGATGAAPNTAGIGNAIATPAAYPGMVISDNRIRRAPIGLRILSTSTDLEVIDNETRTCTTADTIPATAALRRTQRASEGTAIPTTGTWAVGDRVWNKTPSAGSIPGWMCVTAGTPGTWTPIASPPVGARQTVEYTSTATAVTTPAGTIGAYVTLVNAAPGGASGRRGAAGTVRCGGGGSGTAIVSEFWVPASVFGATYSVNVGAGGAGGAAVTADDTNGNAGSAGVQTQFLTGAATFRALIGSAPTGGTNASGLGGTLGAPSGSIGGSASITGGAGVTPPATTTASPTGWYAPGGGGSGGGITTGDVAGAGGGGAQTNGWTTTSTAGSGGVVGGATPTAGSPMSTGFPSAGSGGGAASTTTAAQAGANGTFPGGGAGGGGASLNGNNSGAGGTGGAGYARVTFLFS